ncbi:sidestep protein, putative, partial [Ixodes scapularis]
MPYGLFVLNTLNDLGNFLREVKKVAKVMKLQVVGDFNAPHVVWVYHTSNKKETNVHNAAQKHQLTLCNDRRFPTRIRHSVSKDTSPDFTLLTGLTEVEWTRQVVLGAPYGRSQIIPFYIESVDGLSGEEGQPESEKDHFYEVIARNSSETVDRQRAAPLVYKLRGVPPETPVIRDKYGNIVDKVAGPYREGESLTLICEVKGGVPQPLISWWRNSTEQLPSRAERSSHGVTRSTLEVTQLRARDLNASLSCRASDNNRTYTVASSVTLDIY